MFENRIKILKYYVKLAYILYNSSFFCYNKQKGKGDFFMALVKSIKLRRMLMLIASILSLAVALIFSIIDGQKEWEIAVHPILTFFLIFFTGISLTFLLNGLISKYPWHTFCGGGLFLICLVYALIDCFNLAWWIIVIIAVTYLVLLFVLSVFTAGNKTEDMALNNHVEYKDYKTRYAEKAELERLEEEAKGEAPVIKSFKIEE